MYLALFGRCISNPNTTTNRNKYRKQYYNNTYKRIRVRPCVCSPRWLGTLQTRILSLPSRLSFPSYSECIELYRSSLLDPVVVYEILRNKYIDEVLEQLNNG